VQNKEIWKTSVFSTLDKFTKLHHYWQVVKDCIWWDYTSQ